MNSLIRTTPRQLVSLLFPLWQINTSGVSAIRRGLKYSTPQCYHHQTALYHSTFIPRPLNPFTIHFQANPATLVTTNIILAPNSDHFPASEEGSHRYLLFVPNLRSPRIMPSGFRRTSELPSFSKENSISVYLGTISVHQGIRGCLLRTSLNLGAKS